MHLANLLDKLKGVLNQDQDLNDLNQMLQEETGIREFFDSQRNVDEFIPFLQSPEKPTERSRDLGDFQTPPHLCDQICNYLLDTGLSPDTLIEPTCGGGTFIISALKSFPSLKYIYCIEKQRPYEWLFKRRLLQELPNLRSKPAIEFHRDDFFTHNFSETFLDFLNHSTVNLLILGNPPWVTNTELSVLKSNNLPHKSNIKQVRGIEAITGKGNFDIAEFIILRLIEHFQTAPGKIAMLCKTSVMRNIVRDMGRLDLHLSNIQSLLINSKKEFNIAAESGVFLADLGGQRAEYCSVSSLDKPDTILREFGWVNSKFVSDIKSYRANHFIEGHSPLVWRQGVKHDAAKVMILTKKHNKMLNGLKELVQVEPDTLYPFIKSSDLKAPVITDIDRRVILTQHSLKDKTSDLASNYPKLWHYLIAHSNYLDKRKSAIYKNRPRFAIFGIGAYAFKPFKVAISGFYKDPHFSLIFPIDEKPAMLDDTSYYLYFDSLTDAIFTWILLNHPSTTQFLGSIVFVDAKRPYTKDKLMRVNLERVASALGFETLSAFYQGALKKHLEYEFSQDDFDRYLDTLRVAH